MEGGIAHDRGHGRVGQAREPVTSAHVDRTGGRQAGRCHGRCGDVDRDHVVEASGQHGREHPCAAPEVDDGAVGVGKPVELLQEQSRARVDACPGEGRAERVDREVEVGVVPMLRPDLLDGAWTGGVQHARLLPAEAGVHPLEARAQHVVHRRGHVLDATTGHDAHIGRAEQRCGAGDLVEGVERLRQAEHDECGIGERLGEGRHRLSPDRGCGQRPGHPTLRDERVAVRDDPLARVLHERGRERAGVVAEHGDPPRGDLTQLVEEQPVHRVELGRHQSRRPLRCGFLS